MDFETTPDNDLILDVEKATNRGSLNRRVKFTKMGPCEHRRGSREQPYQH
jgi:hypothetical protein